MLPEARVQPLPSGKAQSWCCAKLPLMICGLTELWWKQAREVMDAMQKDADFSQVQLLKVDGGASNNNLLMQMQADALQVSSRLANQALQFLETQTTLSPICKAFFNLELLQEVLLSPVPFVSASCSIISLRQGLQDALVLRNLNQAIRPSFSMLLKSLSPSLISLLCRYQYTGQATLRLHHLEQRLLPALVWGSGPKTGS